MNRYTFISVFASLVVVACGGTSSETQGQLESPDAGVSENQRKDASTNFDGRAAPPPTDSQSMRPDAPAADSRSADAVPAYDPTEKDITTLQADLAAGRVSSLALVEAYLARVAKLDATGIALQSVLSINPNARADAAALDAERAQNKMRGPLHGVPVLVSDTIETADDLPTTAGSLALVANIAKRDNPTIARLRAAGAVILGKTNLAEWSGLRSVWWVGGWSALGGLIRNPNVLDRTTGNGASGAAVAAAASLAAATVAVDVVGSLTAPASLNGVVGIRPTLGLLSRTNIVPMSGFAETPGPIGRTVRDVASILTAMAGTDPADPATAMADSKRTDYAKGLDAKALSGKRIGVLRIFASGHPPTDAALDKAVESLVAAGATPVEITTWPDGLEPIDLTSALVSGMKAELDRYLGNTPSAVKTRSLEQLIKFNLDTAAVEMPWFDQDIFVASQSVMAKGVEDGAAARATLRTAQTKGLDQLLASNLVDALVAITEGPARASDEIIGEIWGFGLRDLVAAAGYPHVTVPAGYVRGLPVGLSFVGPVWSESLLLNCAYAFEQVSLARKAPTYAPTLQVADVDNPLWDPVKQ